MDLNKVMLIGRLTRDPESRTTPQGASVANFGLATSRIWKDQSGNRQEATEFHNVVAWRKLGEIAAQYLRKGKQVYIEGHLQTRSWDDQSGKKQYKTEIVADNLIMLGSKNDSPAPMSSGMSQQTSAPQSQPQAAQVDPGSMPLSDEEIRIEDIPF